MEHIDAGTENCASSGNTDAPGQYKDTKRERIRYCWSSFCEFEILMILSSNELWCVTIDISALMQYG